MNVESHEFKPAEDCLLFFIDETGHEEFKDPHYPVFGMGGCAQLAGFCHQHIDVPWNEMRARHFADKAGRALHAADLGKPSAEQMEAIGKFFREGLFARIAVMTRITTSIPDEITMLDAVAGTLLHRATMILGRFSCRSVAFIFEVSDRTEKAVSKAFPKYSFENKAGARIPISWLFLPKAAQEPGLQVADFVLHAAGGQMRHKHAGKEGFRRDFESVFRSTPAELPRDLVQFFEISSVKIERTKRPLPSESGNV